MSDKVAIVTDTTACIPPERVTAYGIELVPVEVIFDDKVYRDGIDITPTEFYAMLKREDNLPTTASSPSPFLEAYRRASQKSNTILCLTVSSKFSGMFNSAILASNLAKEELPGVTIEVIECASAAAGQGLVALAAAKAASLGQSLAEVVEVVKGLMPRVHLFASLDTLHYLVKGGRVPQAASLVNSILKMKPVFSVNGGEAHTLALPRSTESAINNILRLMGRKIIKGKLVHVAVMHADAPEQSQVLKDRIFLRFNCVEIFTTEFTPVMGVHTGPGVVGVAFYSED
jgi:DegV family protein with EDD domain